MTLEDLGKEKIIWMDTYYGGVLVLFTDTRRSELNIDHEDYEKYKNDVIRMDSIMFDTDGWIDSHHYVTRDAKTLEDGNEVQKYHFLSEMPPDRAHFAVKILLTVPHPHS